MRKLLEKEEVDELLDKYYPRIKSAIKGGFDDYLAIVHFRSEKGEMTDYSARTIASIIHDNIRMRISREFLDDPEVITNDFNGIFGLLIVGKLLIRFKKFNEDFSTSNIPTRQTINFDNQESIEGFPEVPTFLYCGYIHNGTWSSIKNIYLICREGEENRWIKDLSSPDIEQRALIFESAEIKEEAPLVRAKVIPRKTGTMN
jgi:hypothetical protein